MFNVKPFRAEDFFRVRGREYQANEEHEWFARFCEERSFYVRKDGSIGRSAFTAFEDKTVLGCAGIIIMFGIGSVWMNIDQKLADRPLWLHRTSMRLLKSVRIDAGLRRIGTEIDRARTVNRKWAESLGFAWEGAALNYGPNGETFMHYALTGGLS